MRLYPNSEACIFIITIAVPANIILGSQERSAIAVMRSWPTRNYLLAVGKLHVDECALVELRIS